MKEVTSINEAYIRDDLSSWKATAHEMKCYTRLISLSEFESEKQDIEELPNIQAFTGEYDLLQSLNNYLVSLEFIGIVQYAEDMVINPYILYVYSD